MSNTPSDFDFKFLPDWVKEQPKKNAYADYEGGEQERPPRDFSRPKPRGRDSRDQKGKGGGKRPQGDSQRRGERPSQEERARQNPSVPRVEKPLAVNIEFLPDTNCAAALAKQIKSSARAYPLFDLARMFLSKPDRHRVKITSTEGTKLFQCGEDGPVSIDRPSLERNAFILAKSAYYSEETTQGDPPKGNFSNVARCRLTGTLLGPTNHHGYQPALHKIYEEHFSRRMSFSDYQREIEILSSPEAIEAWKDQARSVTKFTTLQESEPVTMESAGEAERHFRSHYLDKCLREGVAFEISGEASRNLPDRGISSAVRTGWEDENRFPGHVMNHLRREFIHAGLYIFKHRNRVQLVSAIRPTPFNKTQQNLSALVTEILSAIAATPKCARSDLAAKILPAHAQEDPTQLKSLLASDLHWLTHAGHVIEFHNGILELPLSPNPANPAGPAKPAAGRKEDVGLAAKKAGTAIPSAPATPVRTEPPAVTRQTEHAEPAVEIPELAEPVAEKQPENAAASEETAPEIDPAPAVPIQVEPPAMTGQAEHAEPVVEIPDPGISTDS